jgi:hypothetical protein
VAAPLAAITSATAPTTTGMRSGPFVPEVYCAAARAMGPGIVSEDIPAHWPRPPAAVPDAKDEHGSAFVRSPLLPT